MLARSHRAVDQDMDAFFEFLARGVEQLIARADGPLHFRLFVMPTVVTLLAIRAGLRDARDTRPAFLWGLLTSPADRPRLIRSAVADIGRVFIVAIVMDTAYQIFVLRAFRPVQLLIVAVGCAIVPYVVVRGPVMRVARLLSRKRSSRHE